MLIVALFTPDAEDGTVRELAAEEICQQTGLGASTVYAAMTAMTQGGWFDVKWEDVDPYDFGGRPPRRLFFLRDGSRDALARLMLEFKQSQDVHAAARLITPMSHGKALVLKFFLLNKAKPWCVTEVAAELGKSVGLVHRALVDFEAAGWFVSVYERGADNRSARRRNFSLTAEGETAARQAVAQVWPDGA